MPTTPLAQFMVRVGLLVYALCTYSFSRAEEASYFPQSPDNMPSLNGYAHILSRLDEPPICCHLKFKGREYRFLWLRTFDQPVVIHLSERADLQWTMSVKLGTGQSGFNFDPTVALHTLRVISAKQLGDLPTNFAETSQFWTLKTFAKRQVHDGSSWIIEARNDGRYQIVSRRSPERGLVREIGLTFIKIADLNDQRIY